MLFFFFFAQDDSNKIEIIFTHSYTMYEYKEVLNLFDKEIENHSFTKNISYMYNAAHIALNNFEVQKRMKFQRTNKDSYIFLSSFQRFPCLK